MQLSAAISGRLEEILEKELKNAELAVTKGISSATGQFKEAMRKQVKSAKLGSSLYMARRCLSKIENEP